MEWRRESVRLSRVRVRLRRAGGRAARGLSCRHTVERGAGRLGVPGLRRARQGRLRTGRVSTAVRPTYAQATRSLLRERLLDAADELLRERAWASISMADIAGGAGVSRQTLYNELGSREDFAQAYILRESDRFLATVEQAVRAHLDDPHAALRAAFEVFLSA